MTSAHNEGAVGTYRPGLSLNLKPYRERSGITLESVAVVTGIGLHFLRAIEAEEFAKLPGGVYNTSYIRQYARAVGYDEAELLKHYHRLTPPKPPDETELPHGRFSEWLGGHPNTHFRASRLGKAQRPTRGLIFRSHLLPVKERRAEVLVKVIQDYP